MILVKALNSDSCAIMFINNTATCYKDGIKLFTAYATPNSLFILDENSFAFYAIDLED